MRKPIIIGNWKMNMSIAQGIDFISKLEASIANDQIEVGIAPQTIALAAIKEQASKVLIGAQNVYFEENGAFTGETSPLLLEELGLNFSLVGHSERRQYFNETDVNVNKKAIKLLEHNITPVICVGETLEEFEANLTQKVIEDSVATCLSNLDITKVVVAYEPVWAIGTGKTATFEQAQNVCKIIREKLASMYNNEAASQVRIQYGGSVNETNISELLACPDIDGALVGGASLKIESFSKMVQG
ncbi:MAG: triose-phosphate isomerase [Bacilli bacterium]